MTTLIFGIGIGLFVILALWVLAALIFLVSLRVEKKVGVIAILFVGAITIILLSVPRASEKPTTKEIKIYDNLFIWRTTLIILFIISTLINIVACIKFGLMEPVRPIRISNWVL